MEDDAKPNKLVLPNGEEYRATVLRVTKSDAKGPREFVLLRDDESVDVEEGMQFWIVYASEKVLAKVN